MPIPYHLLREPFRSRSRLPELILERGRIDADAIRRSGDIWAQTIAQAAGGIGEAIRQGPERKMLEEERAARSEERRAATEEHEVRTSALRTQEREKAALRGALESGKARDEILAQTPGDLRATVQKHWDEADERANKLDDARMEYIGGLAASVKGAPPELRTQFMAGAITHMRARSYNSEADQAEQLIQQNPDKLEAILDHYIKLAPSQRKAGAPHVVQGALVDPTGKVLYRAPTEQKPETRGLDVQAADALARGDTAEYERLKRVKKEMGQADDRPRDPLAEELARLRIEELSAKTSGEKAQRTSAQKTYEILKEMGDEIISKVGPAQRATALKRGAEAVFGSDPNFRAYQDLKMSLAGRMARMFDPRPSDVDLLRVWAPMIPDPYTDTAASAKIKWGVVGLAFGGEDPRGKLGGAAAGGKKKNPFR